MSYPSSFPESMYRNPIGDVIFSNEIFVGLLVPWGDTPK